ncbi:uncharacterized protein VTP21DRAFT_10192 [Calcarisporiella thermophila]|uniref:uncharacterized protein n=1 Tax=Calcarisporiella thermophila TaxID=911321 RepID=UPI003743ADA6
MHQKNIGHRFIFDFPDHAWFKELSGMRKSAYTLIKEENSSEVWELHLKPSRDRSNIFGYLIKSREVERIVREQQENLLRQRRLPLVLDLDDTLVRLVGNSQDRYVKEHEASLVQDRVCDLGDGRRVVMTERLDEFLDWASKYYEISVCSLGDQNYVDMVCAAIDPHHNRIRGINYSARQEYEYIQRTAPHGAGTDRPSRPPKDLLALYTFCTLGNSPAQNYCLPLIVDDMTSMWPPEQHDNIIVVKERRKSPNANGGGSTENGGENGANNVWTVNLFPLVQQVLAHVHQEFFRQMDLHRAGQQPHPPSARVIYKEWLRNYLRDHIARTSGPPMSVPQPGLPLNPAGQP